MDRFIFYFLCCLLGQQIFMKNSQVLAAEPQVLAAEFYDDTTYGLSISMAQDRFAKLNYFEKLYGKPSFYPHFSVQGYFLDLGFINLGVRGDLGYISLSGFASQVPLTNSPSDADIVKDTTQKVSTTMIPVQLLATSQIRFFNSDIVGAEVFCGYQEMYMTDVRVFEQVIDGGGYYSSTWSSALVYGGGLRFKLNFLDEQSTSTMSRTTGFHSVYLNVFAENKSTLKMSKALISREKTVDANFSGLSWGVGFLFLGD